MKDAIMKKLLYKVCQDDQAITDPMTPYLLLQLLEWVNKGDEEEMKAVEEETKEVKQKAKLMMAQLHAEDEDKDENEIDKEWIEETRRMFMRIIMRKCDETKPLIYHLMMFIHSQLNTNFDYYRDGNILMQKKAVN